MIRFICFLLIELSCVLIIKAQDNSISKYISFEKQLFLDYDIHGPVKFNYSKSICSNEIAITFTTQKRVSIPFVFISLIWELIVFILKIITLII